MDTCERTAKLIDNTYKNLIDEFGPCVKQLIVVGHIYRKSVHGMVAAFRNYTDALSRVAILADKSTLKGSTDIGAALHHIVEVNKEMLAQESNVMKSLEFDFLAPMETAADQDIKLAGQKLKAFQQLHKNKKTAFDKSASTLKKSRRKKSINADKQLAHMKSVESSRSMLEDFCDESLREAIIEERTMYGTVLERQCALNSQMLIYYRKGAELLQLNLDHWKSISETRDALPNSCLPLHPITDKQFTSDSADSSYHTGSPVESVTLRNPPLVYQQRAREYTISTMSRTSRRDADEIYARPMVRAMSEYHLPTSTNDIITKSVSPPSRFSRIVEYNGETSRNYVRVLYSYESLGDHQLTLHEGDFVEFIGEENATGWQFGRNLSTNRSGWFPLSYTEPLHNGQNGQNISESSSSRSGSTDVGSSDTFTSPRRPLPPPPPTTSATVRSSPVSRRLHHSETMDYGTLKHYTPRRLLPVDPPILSQEPPHVQMYQNTFQHTTESYNMPTEDNDDDEEKRKNYSSVIYINNSLQSAHL